ncbi:MAG: DNA mismatch repair protein MutS, partial [Phycisphaerales bacterium]
MAKDPRDTPAMRQFYAFKRAHPGCVLLFRMGDFYELFDTDAVEVSKAIGLTLTQRSAGMPMAGVPHHQKDIYIRKLIDAGFRVAVADQVQDPKEAKGVVDRAVTQVITPGTLIDDSLIDDEASIRLASIAFAGSGDDGLCGVAIIDPGTGDFEVFDCAGDRLGDELARRGVRELLYAEVDGIDGPPPRVARAASACGSATTPRPGWQFRRDEAFEAIKAHYKVNTLAGFGLADDDPAIPACGAAIAYLTETQTPDRQGGATLAHLAPPRREPAGEHCLIDAISLRALEVEQTIRGGSLAGSLLGVFLTGSSLCRTPMGKRTLREWLKRPLAVAERVRERQAKVGTLVSDRRVAAELGEALDGVQDVARIAGRLALGRATPRDLVGLGTSLVRAEAIGAAIEHTPPLEAERRALLELAEKIGPVAERIERSCVESPPAHLREGGLIREGVDAGLDEARSLQHDAGAWLAEYQQKLIEEFDLPSLKVGYNKAFGYYIELPAAQARRAPDRLTRKQTLKNAERYITPELKEFEDKVLTAEARAIEREQALFASMCEEASKVVRELTAFAETAAALDAALALADHADRHGWARPEILEVDTLSIIDGRHPVLEQSMGRNFVPNSVDLAVGDASRKSANDASRATLALITGPNMAGKSTFIRQTALLVLLAQAGSFVPASAMSLGVRDRIFTRVGADDALHQGQSTFMVEMTETANILNHA